MLVKVEFVIETEDYGEEEFKREVEKLIKDIDPATSLEEFRMYGQCERCLTLHAPHMNTLCPL